MADDRVEVAPQSEVVPAPISVSAELRQKFAESICEAYDTALSDREGRDFTLRVADRNYEMEVEPRVYPWHGASNVFIPVIPEQVDSVVANTFADVMSSANLFLILGLTDEAAASQHKLQSYYNSRLTARRGLGMQTWLQEAEDWLHLSTLHGTSYLDVTYLRKKTKRKYAIINKEQSEDGTPVLDLETGEPQITTEIREVSVTEYDDVLWEALEEREVLLIPARAKSAAEADARVRIMYYTEGELLAMSAQKTDGSKPLFDRAAVNLVINSSIADGDSERMQDQRGTEHLDVGGQINTDTIATSNTVGGRLRSTEYEVLRVDTSMFALTKDGDPEHLIMWVHRNPRVMLGVIPFPYHHGRSTLVPFSIMRRPRRAYGRGVPEILRTIQAESNANTNQRRDSATIKMMPPMRRESGVKIIGGENGEWGPNVTFVGAKDSVELLQMGDVLPSSERRKIDSTPLPAVLRDSLRLQRGRYRPSARRKLKCKQRVGDSPIDRI